MLFLVLTFIFAIGFAEQVFIQDRLRIRKLESDLERDSVVDEIMLEELGYAHFTNRSNPS